MEVRSNSRISGRISLPTVTCGLGQAARAAAAAARSFAGFAYALTKEIASAPAPASQSARASRAISSGSTGSSTVPSARTRSRASTRRLRGIAGSKCPVRPQVVGRSRRRISSTSRKPAVVIRPAGPPLRSSSAFVPTVVPCTMVAFVPSPRPAAARPARKPSASLPRVDGTFAVQLRPFSSSRQEEIGERAADIDADDDLAAAHDACSGRM